MNNKVVIGLVVFLFLISLGLGYWSYNLNNQIGTLNSETQAFRTETASQFSTAQSNIASLSTNLADFKSETSDRFSATQGDITSLNIDLANFKSETSAQFTTAKSDIAGLSTNLADFKAQFAESTMEVRKIYDGAVGGVCQVTDGEDRLGSGFVFSEDGYIVTAWHVINNVNNVVVILHDGTLSNASIVGSDKYSDIAVLKVEGGLNLKSLELADSGAVVRGEPVIVIGTPFELSDTVTYGIVSRSKGMLQYPDGDWWVCNLIQYDAATNFGNSGGPVVNARGQVIGMAAYIITPGAGSGIAWSISSNKINRVARAIIDNGSFKNAVLPGTWRMSDLTPEAARERGLETGFGALFLSAQNVGKVEANDIVVAVDGVAVNEAADLFNYIGEFKSPGDTITLTLVIRGGIKIEVSIELIEGWIY
jgi:S1-C subfamily serine protease